MPDFNQAKSKICHKRNIPPHIFIKIVANSFSSDQLRDIGVGIETYYDTSDETLWQRIKAFFGFDAGMGHEADLKRYRDSLKSGNTLVVVDEDLVPASAFDNHTSKSQSTTKNSTATRTAKDAETIRLEAERLQVNKQAIETGQAVIHKRVVENVETVDVPVKHEEIVIERVPVADGTPAGSDDFKMKPSRSL